jgi:hypothetical protein
MAHSSPIPLLVTASAMILFLSLTLTQLHHKALFNDFFIHVLDPWRSPRIYQLNKLNILKMAAGAHDTMTSRVPEFYNGNVPDLCKCQGGYNNPGNEMADQQRMLSMTVRLFFCLSIFRICYGVTSGLR